jgi:hypothetical protein
MTVALLSLMLALTWVRRRWRERKTLTVVDSQSAGLGISVQSGAPYQGKDKEGIQKI